MSALGAFCPGDFQGPPGVNVPHELENGQADTWQQASPGPAGFAFFCASWISGGWEWCCWRGVSPGGDAGSRARVGQAPPPQPSLPSAADWVCSRPHKAHVILVFSVPKGGILSSFIFFIPCPEKGFPDSSVGKEFACNAGDRGSIPGSGRSPGEGKGYPLQYSWASLVTQLVKESACHAGDLGSIPGLERSAGEGKGYPLQYSGLEGKGHQEHCVCVCVCVCVCLGVCVCVCVCVCV